MNEPHVHAIDTLSTWSSKSDENTQIVNALVWCLTNPLDVMLLSVAAMLALALYEMSSSEEKTD